MSVKPAKIDIKEAQDVIFRANPGPQEDFLAASEQEVLYGGAAGGGKSYAMVADPLRGANNQHMNALLVRRTTEELRELKSICQELYPRAVPGARFREKESTWYFPAGGKLWLSYLDNDEDLARYQGQAFTWIGFDELTHWPTAKPWDYLRSRLRTTTASGLSLYQRATTNPGGVGHQWVKKMFIDPAPPNTPFWATDPDTGEILRFPKDHKLFPGKKLLQRKFIPATLFDNPYLAEDGMYEANLLSMPEHERRRLLEGDWSVAEGAAFPEFNHDVHVIEPFDIPRNWWRFRACDYGYGSWSAVLWFAVSPSGDLFVYRELYVHKVLAVDLADEILALEADEFIRYGVLDSSLWHNRGDTGPSLAEQMVKRGCIWTPADRSKGSRIAGKNELHRRLQVDEYTGNPSIYFFNTCTNLINQLPSLPLDKKNPEDVDTKAEDHIYDALRYGVMTRPQSKAFDFNAGPQRTGFQALDKTFGY